METNNETYIKMDYNLSSTEDRLEKTNEILSNTPSEKLSSLYLERLADYLIFTDETKKENKKTKELSTINHNVTVNKRELSFEGLVGKLENGEDGIYNMIANDKNIIFTPKMSITKEQYVLKSLFVKSIHFTNIRKSPAQLDLTEKITIDAEGGVHSSAFINLYTPAHISLLLCNYSKIKEETWDKFNSDTKWLMEDLDNLIERNIKEQYPLYYDLIIYKIDGKSNAEIQSLLGAKHKIHHSVEYISSLWRNKIPKLLAEAATREYLLWHYTFEEKGRWKKCSKCGQIKLAHNIFFSKNSTSKDHFYSICKECRNAKTKKILPKGGE